MAQPNIYYVSNIIIIIPNGIGINVDNVFVGSMHACMLLGIRSNGSCGGGITQIIKTGRLVSSSEQQLVDCATYGNRGCYDGWMDNAFWYILQNRGGITTEANYPYQYVRSEESYCQPRPSYFTPAQITGNEDVPTNDEEALLKAVSQQPVAVAL